MIDFVPVPPGEDNGGDGAEQKTLEQKRRAILEAELALHKAYPGIWPKVTQKALTMAQEGRRVSARDLLGAARSLDLMGNDGKPIHVNNQFSVVWARRLLKEHPELKEHIVTKRSWVDGFLDDVEPLNC